MSAHQWLDLICKTGLDTVSVAGFHPAGWDDGKGFPSDGQDIILSYEEELLRLSKERSP